MTSIFALILSFAVAILCVPGMVLDSDVLVPEMMFRDMFVSHTSMSGWNFCSALFLFPDTIFYFLIRAFSSNLSVVFLIYGALQLWLVYWIFRIIRPAQSLLLFFVWTLLWIAIFPREWTVLLWPVFHGGSMLSGVFFALWYIRKPVLESWVTAALIVFGAIALASDFFFGVQTLLPLGILSLYAWKRKDQPGRYLLKQIGLGLLLVLISFGFSKTLYTLMQTKPLNFTYIHPQFHWAKVLSISQYLLSYKLSFVIFVIAFWRAWKTRREYPIYSWMMLSLSCNVTFVLVADIWFDKLNVRYFLCFSLFVGLILANEVVTLLTSNKMVWRSWGWGIAIFFALCAVPAGYGYVNDWPAQSIFQQPRPAEVACFDQWQAQYGLQDGVADYWLAKTIPLLSQTHPNLMQMRDEPKEFKWLNNSRWYDGIQKRQYFLYDVRDGRPNRQMVFKKWGDPAKKDICGAFELWIYDKNVLEELEHDPDS